MDDHELIFWIKREITSTTVVMRDEIIGYEESLEPNPELNFCEFTSYPVCGQHIIVSRPVCGKVARAVPDTERALKAADILVELVLRDERHLRLAEEFMEDPEVFAGHWEYLAIRGKDRKTVRRAVRHIGRAPDQIFFKHARKMCARLKGPLEFLGKAVAAVCIYGTIIYIFWPKSRLGQYIGTIIKRVLIEAKNAVYG